MTGTDAVGKSIFESITHVLDRVSTGGGETNARLPRPARCGNDAPWKLVEKSYGPPENPLLPPGPDFSTSFHRAWKSRKRRGISTFPQRRRRLISAVKKSDPTRLRRRARDSCCQKWLPSSRQGGCALTHRPASPSCTSRLPSLAHRGRAVETRETNSIKLEFVSPPPTKSSRAACTSTCSRLRENPRRCHPEEP